MVFQFDNNSFLHKNIATQHTINKKMLKITAVLRNVQWSSWPPKKKIPWQKIRKKKPIKCFHIWFVSFSPLILQKSIPDRYTTIHNNTIPNIYFNLSETTFLFFPICLLYGMMFYPHTCNIIFLTVYHIPDKRSTNQLCFIAVQPPAEP